MDSVNEEILKDIEALEIASSLKVLLKGIIVQLKFEPNKIYDQ